MNLTIIKSSFYITYVFLITTGTICFIEALRSPIPQVRHIMNLETCISVVAGYFYSQFVKKIDNQQQDEQQLYKTINDTRYTDWAISTPLMLLVLCMVLGYENKLNVHFSNVLYILLLNFLMLGSGYIGEVNMIPKLFANIIGFVFFFGMYRVIWNTYMKKSRTFNSKVIFYCFLILWAFYGLFYNMDVITKIFGYNILDLLAKAFVGIFFWLYLTKTIKF